MLNFTNQTIDLDQLPKYEETELTKPMGKYWNIILINILISLLFIGIGLTLLIVFVEKVRANWWLWNGLFFAFALFLLLIYRASFKRRGFALREKDVLYKSGVIAEKTIIIPLKRIQHVALNEGMFSRMFGLGTLQIYTAGGSSGEVSIAGIDIEKAKAIKEALVQRLVINLEIESNNVFKL